MDGGGVAQTKGLTEEQSKALRAPFPPSAVGKLPKGTCKDCSNSPQKVCGRHQKRECPKCGNYMTTAHLDLDYVGHAEVTDRLLSVDPGWTWAPYAVAPDGGPLIRQGGKELTLWIKLTIAGVTRLGVGSVASSSFDSEKQLIGDAIRNAAMRFGVALDLWSKNELESASHVEEDAPGPGRPSATDLGWATDAEAKDAHASLRSRINVLPPEWRTEFENWMRTQLIPWPCSPGQMVTAEGAMDELEGRDV